MSLPHGSVSSMAKALAVKHCMGMSNGRYCGDINTFEAQHKRGFVQGDTVHYAERRVNKSVIRSFCMLVAELESAGAYSALAPWEVRWRTCVDAEHIARLRLRVRIPRSAWDLDRWTVRAQLASVPTDTPGRKEAMAWSSLVAQ